MRSDLPERIRAAMEQDAHTDGAHLAAQAAMTFFAEAIAQYGNVGTEVPLIHTRDCEWVTNNNECTCGFDDLHYDLIWARMYPTPRKENDDA